MANAMREDYNTSIQENYALNSNTLRDKEKYCVQIFSLNCSSIKFSIPQVIFMNYALTLKSFKERKYQWSTNNKTT